LQQQLPIPKTWADGETSPTTLYMVGSSSSTNLESASGTLDLTYKATLAADGIEQSIKDTVGVTLLPVEVVEEIESGETTECTGYDKDDKALMVPMQGSNKIMVKINAPTELLSKIRFVANNPSKLTIQPETPTSTNQVLTLSGVAQALGVKVQLDVNGSKSDLFEADVLKRFEKTLEIHAITEQNDDVQTIPVGQGQPNQICITAGSNSTLNSTPGGDDTISCNTINTGPNGICESVAFGDDIQAIAWGKGQPNAICVGKGANNFRDTLGPTGDDAISGDDLNTGTDGICNTTANSQNIVPSNVPSAQALQDFLNQKTWGNQANVHFSVTRTDHLVNYDLDRNASLGDPVGYGNIPALPQELQAINNSPARNASVNYNYYITKAVDVPIAITQYNPDVVMSADQATVPFLTIIAHECGHLLKGSGGHTDGKITYLMHTSIDAFAGLQVQREFWRAVNK